MKRLILAKDFQKTIKNIVRIIKNGKVIVCPTDTVYGLLGDATNEKAVKKILRIKKRPATKPIPIFLKDLKMAKNLAYINKKQEKFLRKVWPGKATVVLKAKKKLPKGILGLDNTIGFRIPKYKILNRLLLIINRPLSATSANISGKPASTKIKEVIKQFKNQKYQPDLILDAGNLKSSKPSTVINLIYSKLKILRGGAIKKEKLKKYFDDFSI